MGAVWCLAPLLRDRALVSGDIVLYDLPRLEVLARWLRAGSLPGWNPYMSYGGPLLADPAVAAGYPLHALLLLASPLVGLHLLGALHVGLAWAGAWALARARGLSPGAACLTGAAWGLSGVISHGVLYPPHLQSAAWVPWALACTQRALDGPRPLPALLAAAAAFALSFLGGAPEATLGAGLLAALLALADAVPARRAVPRLGLIALGAAALSAHVLVPFLAFLGESTRGAGLARAEAAHFSLRVAELPGLLLPALGAELVPAGGEERTWFGTLYVGPIPLAAALLALPGQLRRRRGWTLLAGAGVFVLYAAGPLHSLLWELFPPVRAMRYPAKFLPPALLVLALLAGQGFARGSRRAWRRALLGLAACALLAVGAGVVAGRGGLAVRALQPALVAALAAWWVGRPRPVRPLLALAVADLLLAGVAYIPTVPAAALRDAPALAGAVAEQEHASGMPERVASTESAWTHLPEASEAARRDALFMSSGAGAGVRAVQTYGGLLLWRSSELVRLAIGAPPDPRDPVRSLALLGARLVVTRAVDVAPDSPHLRPVAAHGPWLMVRVVNAPPWAQLLGRAEAVAGPAEARERLLQLDPRRECLVEGLPALEGPAGEAGRVQVLTLGADHLRLRVEATRPAVLLLREAWSPGWRATVDGAAAPVVPADLAFRAVPIAPGQHEVAMEYVVPGRRAGTLLAGGAWLLLLVVGLALRRT